MTDTIEQLLARVPEGIRHLELNRLRDNQWTCFLREGRQYQAIVYKGSGLTPSEAIQNALTKMKGGGA